MSNETQPTTKPPAGVFSGALAWLLDRSGLAIAPAVGYYLVFRYEAAYCAAFGIPSTFVQPSLTTILVFASVAFAFGPQILGVLEGFLWAPSEAEDTRPIVRGIRIYFPAVTLLVFVFVVATPPWRLFLMIFILIAGLCILDLLASFAREGGASKSRIYRLNGPFHWISLKDKASGAAHSYFGKYSIYVVLVYAASLMANIMGSGAAYKQTEFLVPKARPEMIVVRIYDSRAICVAVDPETKKPMKIILIGSIGSEGLEEFETKNIGPLDFN